MALVHTQTPSGLVVASEGSDERAAAAALREYDCDLRLVPQDSDTFGRRVYKVYRYAGPDHPALFVCGWWDELGNPYPLSASGLLELVKRLDRNTRSSEQSADVHNAELVAHRRQDADAELDEIEREFGKRLSGKWSQPLPRSRSLYAARNRARAKTKTPELKP